MRIAHLLIYSERPERIAQGRSFVLRDLSKWFTVAHWFERNEQMSDERMSKFPALHKPTQATDSPHPFKKRTQRAHAILMWWILFFNMMCGVTFSQYFEWEDGIKCQKSNLTKFSPVRCLKFGQIKFLTLDSISPVKTLGKIHPRSTTFKLAQKCCRKRPAAQISKTVHKEWAQFNAMNLIF